MARDLGLEELVTAALGGQHGVTGRVMFGGWAFLLRGNLLCGARAGSLMLRVGRNNETWALSLPGVLPVLMRGRRMQGYVRAAPEAYADDAIRQRLIEVAVSFTLSLPGKDPSQETEPHKKGPAAGKQVAKSTRSKR